MSAADRVCRGRDLLDDPNLSASMDTELANVAKRFYRNGVAIGCFAAFEAFVDGRCKEVAAALNTIGLPRSAFPDTLIEASKTWTPHILVDMSNRTHRASQLDQSYGELSRAWSNNGGAWVVPQAVFQWKGSNLQSQGLLRVLGLFGIAKEWNDLTGLVQGLGVSPPLPTEAIFSGIAETRHNSAHEASFSAEVLQLRSTPRQLLSLAFAFDSLLSVAAATVAHAQTPPAQRGRKAVELTRLVWRKSTAGVDEWAEYRGMTASSTQARRARKVWHGDCINSVALAHNGLRDVVVALRIDPGGATRVVDWRTPVI